MRAWQIIWPRTRMNTASGIAGRGGAPASRRQNPPRRSRRSKLRPSWPAQTRKNDATSCIRQRKCARALVHSIGCSVCIAIMPGVRVRFHIIRNARIENVGKSQSCMVSKLRIIWKQTVCVITCAVRLAQRGRWPGWIPLGLPVWMSNAQQRPMSSIIFCTGSVRSRERSSLLA